MLIASLSFVGTAGFDKPVKMETSRVVWWDIWWDNGES